MICTILLVLFIENFLIIYTGYERHTLHEILSFLILIAYIRSLRESWKRILFVVLDSLAIMIIILSYITFFTLMGYTLFSSHDYQDPYGFFQDIPSSLFNIYVLFTTSNFPDILFPFWKVNNLTAPFFVGFLLIGLYMLLNFMLAVFYNSYKKQIEKKIAKYDNLREAYLMKEFQTIAAIETDEAEAGVENREYITVQELTQHYG
jgi:TRAP-type C4-dicarboxylate transport system permease large subunit